MHRELSYFNASLFTDTGSKVIIAWCDTSVSPRQRYYYYSNDYGNNWVNISNNFFTTGNNEFNGYGEFINGAFYMYAPTSISTKGLYKSLDGVSWTLLGNPNFIDMFKQDNYGGGSHGTRIVYYNGKYYGYAPDGVYESNNMLTWSQVKAKPTEEYIVGLTKTSTNFVVATYNSTLGTISLYDLDFSFSVYSNKRIILTGETSYPYRFILDNFTSYK